MVHRVPFIVAELDRDADLFMLHLYARAGRKGTRLISERTMAALAAKKASGARLDNPKNLAAASLIGRKALASLGREYLRCRSSSHHARAAKVRRDHIGSDLQRAQSTRFAVGARQPVARLIGANLLARMQSSRRPAELLPLMARASYRREIAFVSARRAGLAAVHP
jgi:hypothetical protein